MSAHQILKSKDKVEKILKVSTEARDSDSMLWLMYMANHHDLIRVLGREAFNNLRMFLRSNVPSFETIGRVRRKFQEQGLYTTTKRQYKMKETKKVKEALHHV